MQPVSVPFVLFALLGLIWFHVARTPRRRKFVLSLLNVALLSTFTATILGLVPLLAFLLLSWGAVRLVNRIKARWLFVTILLSLIAFFVYLKHYAFVQFLPPLKFAYITTGLSYIFFRCLHLLIDTYQKEEIRHDLNAWTAWNYVTSFLSLTAGPIQRYDDFLLQEATCTRDPALTQEDVLKGFSRIVNGYIKIALLCVGLRGAHLHFRELTDSYLLALTGAAVAHLLYIYVNFSGYMDIMIGFGRLFGMTLPENFDSPLRSTNFLDLWNRWHITLSQWFKTYVFNPLVRWGTVTFPHPALLPYIGVVAYFAVFFLLGLWHGNGYRWVVLGILFGLGVSINKLWEIECKRFLGKRRYQRLCGRLWYQALARALALSYFALAAVASWDWQRSQEFLVFLESMGWGIVMANYLFCVALLTGVGMTIALVTALRDRFVLTAPARNDESDRKRTLTDVWTHLAYNPVVQQASLSLRAVVVVLFLLALPSGTDLKRPRTPNATASAQTGRSRPMPLKTTAIFYGGF